MATHYTKSITGTLTTFTVSTWVKKARLAQLEYMWNGGSGSSGGLAFTTDSIKFQSSGTPTTTEKFRDVSAWYHVHVSCTSGTATLYINGVQVLTSSNDCAIASNIYVGDYDASGSYPFIGVMSHFHFIDGTAYAPTEFGETDSDTGEWIAKTAPSVTYGTNGFFILKDNASGTDQSGNGNNLTGNAPTPTEDCPNNNFATFNNAVRHQCTLTHANTTAAAAGWMGIPATIGLSKGKWYWEYKNTVQTNWGQNGIMSSKPNGGYDGIYSTYVGNNSGGLALNSGNGDFYHDGSSGAYGTSAWFPGMVAGDIISVALDVDASKIWFGKNGTWGNSSDPAAGTNGIDFSGDGDFTNHKPYFPCFSGNAVTCEYNFGNGYFGTTAISSEGTNASNLGKFEFDVPTGFTAICTKGLNE